MTKPIQPNELINERVARGQEKYGSRKEYPEEYKGETGYFISVLEQHGYKVKKTSGGYEVTNPDGNSSFSPMSKQGLEKLVEGLKNSKEDGIRSKPFPPEERYREGQHVTLTKQHKEWQYSGKSGTIIEPVMGSDYSTEYLIQFDDGSKDYIRETDIANSKDNAQLDRYKDNLEVKGDEVYSYGTRVATIKGDKLIVHGYWSQTTSKHVNYVASVMGLTVVKDDSSRENIGQRRISEIAQDAIRAERKGLIKGSTEHWIEREYEDDNLSGNDIAAIMQEINASENSKENNLKDWQCQECGYKFDKTPTGRSEIKCPKCGSTDVDGAYNSKKNKKSVAQIIAGIRSGTDEYYDVGHFHSSNMADYGMMSDTINDMCAVYGIEESQAADIVQALTHS